MTETQRQLVDALVARENGCLSAKWDEDCLDCVVTIKGVNGKSKKQRFSFVFDDASECDGYRLIRTSCKGAYSEVYARRAAEVLQQFGDQLN